MPTKEKKSESAEKGRCQACVLLSIEGKVIKNKKTINAPARRTLGRKHLLSDMNYIKFCAKTS